MSEAKEKWTFVNSIEDIKNLDKKYINIIVNADDCKYKPQKHEVIGPKNKIKTIKFKPRANVDISWVDFETKVVLGTGVNANFNHVSFRKFDFSRCGKVELDYCCFGDTRLNMYNDWGEEKELKFCKNSEVTMRNCIILDDIKKITFGKDSKVRLYNMDFSNNDEIDFSQCAEVLAVNCNFNHVERIKFRNKEQEREIMEGVQWQGKSCYSKTSIHPVINNRRNNEIE